MQNVQKTKQIQVDSSVLFELIHRVEAIESLVETLEINLDKDLLRQLEESKKEFAQGKAKIVRTKEELSTYLSSLG